ncbi:MAG: four helix bundle protein, partial [Saprospiraceae bacterium]
MRALKNDKREYELASQLFRSGTAVGALIEEAIGGQTRKDFYMKLTIAYKEARESKYWLRIIKDTNLMEENKVNELLNDIEEILKIIGSIQKTVRNSN